jgi:hypothetical protein
MYFFPTYNFSDLAHKVRAMDPAPDWQPLLPIGNSFNICSPAKELSDSWPENLAGSWQR